MMVVLIVLGVLLCASVFVALFIWTRNSERDIDYGELRDGSTQTDRERAIKQIGIGLSSTPPPGM